MNSKVNLLTPKTDLVFHSLFKPGNENITKAFISPIIGKKIKDISLNTDRHLEINHPDEKLGILDLKAILDDGIICNIEIQLINHHDIQSRLLLYWSRLFSAQLKSGNPYTELKKTISIAILDYTLDTMPSTTNPHSVWKISDTSNNTLLTDLLELHIIEIPKALKILEKEPNNKVAQWMLFLSDPNNKEVFEIMKTEKEIKEAMDKLEEICSDEELMRIIELREKAERDYQAHIEYATDVGLKQGMEQGIEQEKRDIAKNMLAENMDITIISKITGLSIEEIEKLKS